MGDTRTEGRKDTQAQCLPTPGILAINRPWETKSSLQLLLQVGNTVEPLSTLYEIPDQVVLKFAERVQKGPFVLSSLQETLHVFCCCFSFKYYAPPNSFASRQLFLSERKCTI